MILSFNFVFFVFIPRHYLLCGYTVRFTGPLPKFGPNLNLNFPSHLTAVDQIVDVWANHMFVVYNFVHKRT